MECGSFYVGGSPSLTPTPAAFSSPCVPQDQGFVVIHQKLDGILALFAEQKKILSETKEETASLRKKVELLGSKIEEFEETFEKCSKSASSRPKRVPRDLSVSNKIAQRSILNARCFFAV